MWACSIPPARWEMPGRRGTWAQRTPRKARVPFLGSVCQRSGGTARSRQGSMGCASSPELPCLIFRITTSTRRQRCRQPWLCPSLRTEADPSPCPTLGSLPLLLCSRCKSHLVEEGGTSSVVTVSEQRPLERELAPQGWDQSLDRHLISVLRAYPCVQIYVLLAAFGTLIPALCSNRIGT